MYATQDERDDHFRNTTFATYSFRIRDEFDNGEFMTGATVDLIERGRVVHTETFTASPAPRTPPVEAGSAPASALRSGMRQGHDRRQV